MANFMEMIEDQWAQGKHLCVGLDPRVDPEVETLSGPDSVLAHMTGIVNYTAGIAAAYKPNMAFYESLGWQGLQVLEQLIGYIKAEAPGVPVILDANRGDTITANEHYAKMAFDYFDADAITIHPYLGWEANKPFLDRADKGIFVLCRTSNPGAGEFQDLAIRKTKLGHQRQTEAGLWNKIFSDSPDTLYQHIALNVSNPETWNKNGNCCLVTGATYPDEIRQVRIIAPYIPLLMPGIGKQGVDLEASVMAAKHRFLITSPRGIIFAEDPRFVAETLNNNIKEALASC
jgi:orotidine-5'-phosphate decarboxylase